VAAPTPARGAANIEGTAYQNSGILEKGNTWTANFRRGGSYELVCIVHPLMTMTVNVLQPGTFVPAQDVLNREADRQLESVIAESEAAYAAARVTRTANPNGTAAYESPFVNTQRSAVNRFVPARLQIGVGDTVTWRNDRPGAPHTVTFGAPPPPVAGEGEDVIPNAIAYPVKPSPNYDGTAAYVNSGIIGQPPEGVGGTSFSLTFTRAGTYPYICVLHIDQGMAGVVVVGEGGPLQIPPGVAGALPPGVIPPGLLPSDGGAPGGGAVRPPSTGDAGLAAGASMTPWLLAAAGVLIFGLGGIFLASARLRR
jgi:plastocyanin